LGGSQKTSAYFDGEKNSCPCLESNTIAIKYYRMTLYDLLSGGESKKKSVQRGLTSAAGQILTRRESC
jgi:hypothetical protein